MPRTLHLGAQLAATPAEIFDMYLDAKVHAAITGAPAKVAPRAGAEFSAFDGALRGRILQIVRGQLIVQSWRSTGWKTADLDSTLVLTLLPDGKRGTLIELTQANVADADFAGVSQGWERYYWAPWRAYLEQRGAKPRKATAPAAMRAKR